ncbi:MAG: YqgE/AlgH family protein [Flavobacteriales bacterium]
MIRFTPNSNAVPEQGKILLAEPFMNDVHFGRKAILLCEHNEEGSFGFVLNNYIEVSLNELLDDLPQVDFRLGLGGPVKNSNLYYLHTIDHAPDSIQIMEGLYMGGDFDWVKDVLNSKEFTANSLRFFIGYSGWTPGQLEDEIKSRSWFVTEASVETIMDTKEDEAELWKSLVAAMGPEFDHIVNAPNDPSLN